MINQIGIARKLFTQPAGLFFYYNSFSLNPKVQKVIYFVGYRKKKERSNTKSKNKI